MTIDLDAYLARIGYAGPRAPTRATLDAIIHAHVCAIPFENVDVLLGRRIALEPDALMAKLVHARRGGYCFEQNGLFLEVLRALGFDATPLSARVRIGRARDYTPARTHLLSRVELDGASWLCDVGVGALSPTCALRLVEDVAQATPHEPRRLVREGRLLFHQARLGEDWQDVCELTLEEMPPIDREVANWYTSAHPKSHFKDRLIAARALPGGRRLTLVNHELSERGADGVATKTPLADDAAVVAALRTHFGIEDAALAGVAWPP